MAKNIIIETDGTAVIYNGVKEIETNDPEEGRVTWIPMDETELAIKTVNKNGTYKAKDDGYYGYRRFTVSTKNKGKTVGTKPDGRTYAVDTDDDGYLTETLLPDNIKINPQPTKKNYNDGESISLSGAVVKAYSKDDIWEGEGYTGGVIPHGELTLDPDTASGSGDGTYTDGDGVVAGLYSVPDTKTRVGGWGSFYIGSIICKIVGGSYDGMDAAIATRSTASAKCFLSQYNDSLYIKRADNNTNVDWNLIMIKNGKPFINGLLANISDDNWKKADTNSDYLVPVSNKDPEESTKELHPSGNTQKITVKWNRPEDEEELTDTFDITVS